MHTITSESSASASSLRPHRDIQEFPPRSGECSQDHWIPKETELVDEKSGGKQRPPPLKLDLEHGKQEHPLSSELLPRSSSDSSQMGPKPGEPRHQEPDRPASKATGGQNGYTGASMELRRKHASLESETSTSQTARLMERDDFSLNEKPPLTPSTPSTDTSFFDLPRQDRRNFLLLVLLYFLQGIPMGLASGSVPFLLKSHLSYGQIGVFTLASYPYSLKLLWSPIVDAVWSPALGRRKSWILPIQTFSGLGMIYLGGRIKDMMVTAGANDGSGVWAFTGWWFFLVFLCATQDIAVDGTEISFNGEVIMLTISRLGPHFDFRAKSIIRLNRPNSRTDGRSFSLIHRLPCVQLT